MPDTIGNIHVSETLTIHLLIRRLTNSSGDVSIALSKIEEDVEIANEILSQAGFYLAVDSLEDWESDDFFHIQSGDFKRLRAEHWIYGQSWINVYYVETWENADGACSVPNYAKAHAIGLEDREGAAPTWRGIALAHEIGHYFSLKHPKSPDACEDTDSIDLDPGNLMNQGGDGRTTVVRDIHLTECQVKKARFTCYSKRADLIAPIITAAIG